MAARTFRDWLAGELEKREMPRRELARKLAAQHPEGVTAGTVETYRRAIYKYLDGTSPTGPMRDSFADAFGVDRSEVPSPDDEDEELDMAATLQAMAREIAQLRRKVKA